jgi:glycosyltransferase involved in cell wall biosynthesis
MSFKVSVITVTFNSAATVRHTLESVASQDYPYIEHIVIDGGSTDGTTSIVAEFPHLAYAISEADQGTYFAMNKGLQRSTGDLVCFLNSDDWYTRNDAISLVVKLQREQNVDVVYGDLQFVGRNNPDKIVRTWRSGSFKRNSIYYGWVPPHPTFFACKSVYDKVGFFNTSLINSADYDMMLRILLKHQMNAVYLPFILVSMRAGGLSNRSLSNRLRANREDHLAWLLNGLEPIWLTRYLKPLRKIPQFFLR